MGIPTLLIGTICLLLLSLVTKASHFRYGQITWVQDTLGSGRRIKFTLETAWRASYWGISDDSDIGRGVTNGNFWVDYANDVKESLQISVTSVNSNEDWFIGRSEYYYDYPANGQYVALFEKCCRIGSLHNNANDHFRVSTVVRVRRYSLKKSVSAAFIPIQHILNGKHAYFQLPVYPGTEEFIRYELASASAASGTSNYDQIDGLTLDHESGLISWSPTQTGFYTTQILILGYYSTPLGIGDRTHLESVVALDFIINVVEDSNKRCKAFCAANAGDICVNDDDCYSCYDPYPTPGAAPHCDTNTAPYLTTITQDGVSQPTASNVELSMVYGIPTTITVVAEDSDIEDIVSFSYTSPPNTASITVTDANPAQVLIEWTPSDQDSGTIMCFTASDSLGNSATGQMCVTLILDTGSLTAEGDGLNYAVAGEPNSFTIYNIADREHRVSITNSIGDVVYALVSSVGVINPVKYEYLAQYNYPSQDIVVSGSYSVYIEDITEGIVPDAPITSVLEVAPAQSDPENSLLYDFGGTLGLVGGTKGQQLSFFLQSRDQFDNVVPEEGTDSYFVNVYQNSITTFSGLSISPQYPSSYIGQGIFNMSYTVPDSASEVDTFYNLEVFHQDTQTSQQTLIRNISGLSLSVDSFTAQWVVQMTYTAGELIEIPITLTAGNQDEKDVYVTIIEDTYKAVYQGNNEYIVQADPVTVSGTYFDGISLNSPGLLTVLDENLIVVPDSPNALQSVIYAEEYDAGVGETTEILVSLYDRFGNRIYGEEDVVLYEMVLSGQSVSGTASYRLTDSEYVIELYSTVIGIADISITLASSGELVSGSSFFFVFEAGPFSFVSSTISRPSQLTAGVPFLVKIDAFDQFGNRRDSGSDSFSYDITPLSPSTYTHTQTSSLSADTQTSTYSLVTTTSLSGYYKVSISVFVKDQGYVSFSEYATFVEASSLSLPHCEIEGGGLVGGDALDTTRIYILGADEFKNAVREQSSHVFILQVTTLSLGSSEVFIANYSQPTSDGFCGGYDESLTDLLPIEQVLSGNGFWSFTYEIPQNNEIGESLYSVSMYHTDSSLINQTAYDLGIVPADHTFISSEEPSSYSYASGEADSDEWEIQALAVMGGILGLSLSGYAGWRMHRYREKYKTERKQADSMEVIMEQIDDENLLVKGSDGMDWQSVGAAHVSMNPLHPAFASRQAAQKKKLPYPGARF